MNIKENFSLKERIGTKKSTERPLNEDVGHIHGFVTVIKNIGRPDEEILCEDKENLLTTDGLDEFHQTMYIDTTATQTGFNFIALTADVGAPALGDTALTGEITVNGLQRILASTRTHIDDTNVSTIGHTFTATGQVLNVQKSGLFDLIGPPVAGVLSHENIFTPASVENNDTLTVTWTLTMG